MRVVRESRARRGRGELRLSSFRANGTLRAVRPIAITLACAAAALSGVSVAAGHLVVVGCNAAASKQVALTRSYRFTLRLGPIENMYMPRQVRANHLKHGEVMLRGTMTGPAMLTGGPIRHLEIQICTRPTNAVVTHANPTIIVADKTSGKTTKLPIAVMEDISVGTADLHYGNNLTLPARHHYLVTVSWRGERARFQLSPRR